MTGASAAAETNWFYYSGQGNNLANYMYMELDLQNYETAILNFSTRYDIEENGDFAMAFVSYDTNLIELVGWKLNGNQSEWTTKSYNLSPFAGAQYIGFYYETDDSGIKDGFYVDNIEIIVDNVTTFYDDGLNDDWTLIKFIRGPDIIPPVIDNPFDIQIEQDATGSITWVVTEANPDKYWVMRNSTEVIESPNKYQSGEELAVPIDTSALGTCDYTIFANDTSGNEASDQVNITVQTKVPPTINITSLDDGHSTTSDSVTVSGDVNGTGSTPTVTVNDNLAEVTLTDGYSGIFSVSVSLLIGDNTINATVTDAAGMIEYDSIAVTRNAVDSSSSSSSGGGGGGGASGEDFNNILVSKTEREYVNKDSKTSYSFDLEGNIIRYINFTGLTSSGRIAAKIDILKSTSTLVDHAPPDKVFKNMGIFVGNLGWANPNNIANPTIGFIVNKTWVNENEIDISSITLNRYSDGKWNPLETSLIYEDSGHLYLESKTPGFSQFAVTGTETSTEQSDGKGIVVEPIIAVERKEPITEQTPDEKNTGIPGFGILPAFSIMLVVVQLLCRKQL